MLAKRS